MLRASVYFDALVEQGHATHNDIGDESASEEVDIDNDDSGPVDIDITSTTALAQRQRTCYVLHSTTQV